MSGDTASDERRLADLGEREILAQVLQPRYRDTVGFGDDCAVLSQAPFDRGELVATTDNCPAPLVDRLGERDLFNTGWLLVTVNLSDLAAAGATPLGLVVNYTLPRQTTVRDFRRLLDGVDACAAHHHTAVVGGDLRDGDTLQLSATAIGQCAPDRRLGRRGGGAGDRLLLIGSPGYLWAYALLAGGQARLSSAEAAEIRHRAQRPTAQLPAGRLLAESGLAVAAMDVSDGLYATVRTICEINQLGASVHTDLRLDPVLTKVCEQAGIHPFDLAQTWGDWGLVAVVRERDVETAIAKVAADSIAAQEIGTLVEAADGLTLESGGDRVPWRGTAHERFTAMSWDNSKFDVWRAHLTGAPET